MQKSPIVIAICGPKKSGKTLIIEQLIRILKGQGVSVVAIKLNHAHVSLDTPRADSYRYFKSGAISGAVLDVPNSFIMYHGNISLDHLISVLSTLTDIILLEEGSDYSEYPKIQVIDESNSQISASTEASCIAYVSNIPLQTQKSVFAFSQMRELAHFILASEGLDLNRYKKHASHVKKAKKLIARQVLENSGKVSVGMLAKELGFSQNYFGKIFKMYTGMSVLSYANSLRFRRSVELLRTTDMRIYEIAEAVGLQPEYFSIAFKQNFGVTPSEFRDLA